MRALTPLQNDDIRAALKAAEARTHLRFAVYVGRAEGARREFAERLHAALGAVADDAVLIMVDVDGRALEIVTGERARRFITDGACQLVAVSMAGAFAAGDLTGGLVTGISALAECATRG
ncbi:TPM domain-containing protein [Microtetraspora sp. NBRC 16547]|uniref:TPM domain-containing protein n=1 Tax=Microtetraspora sp. NBRC 16547 TaxID=3030993 RepID=UPI0025524D09|nr:TPM domain-containing protein [Microtetraspora sp. NBRC 16547]